MIAEFWRVRTAREQVILIVGGGVLVLALLFQLIVAPLAGWRRSALASVVEAEGLYEIVSRAAVRAANTPDAGEDGERPLRGIVTASAQAAGVSLVFVNVRPDGSVEAAAGPTAPAAVFAWVSDMTQAHGASVIYADITRTAEAEGAVRGRLIFAP